MLIAPYEKNNFFAEFFTFFKNEIVFCDFLKKQQNSILLMKFGNHSLNCPRTTSGGGERGGRNPQLKWGQMASSHT